MRSPRLPVLIALLAIVAAATWYYYLQRMPRSGETLAVYYTKLDGKSLGEMSVSLRPRQAGESAAERLHNTALYAAVEALAGPPNATDAIRFPPGTRVLGVAVNDSTATVDLSKDVERQAGGSFGENGEFKALVYTLTGIRGINAVQVTVDGTRLETLPGDILNLINRFIARTGNAGAAAVAMLLGTLPAIPALADAPITAQYQGQSIRFSHLSSSTGALAIGVNDPGFAALLRSTGSVLTWKPGERYILITTSEPTVVSFAIGDRRYDVGPIALQASIAPYERGEEAFLPLNEVLRSLDLALRQDGAGKVLQPQLATLDVRQVNDLVVLSVHGGATLHPRVVRQTGSEVVYAFDGVGTTLSGTRQINAGGVRSVQVQSSGAVRDPTTLVTVELETGATVRPVQNTADRDVVLSFGSNSAAPQPVAAESPTPEPAPSSENGQAGAPAANGAALVTSVTAQASAGGTTVAVAVTGNAQYEWHRLRDPDNRFWIDVKTAQLQGSPIEQAQQSPLVSMRVRQLDAATVRIALSLDGPKTISINPSATGLAIEIGNEEVADAARSGSGSVGNVISSSPQTTAIVTPAPLDNASSQAGPSNMTTWKFGPRSSYVSTNPRLIVIDPGHGGSDRGTIHGGVSEADLTLDMAKRLRDILVARGWQVKLTHETDVDVYAPNDSPHDELQARVDVANNAGARLFVSIHVNAFINSGPYGTTYYISKPDDTALASAMETHLESDGTKDDGIVKSHLYVTYHTKMPAVLVETAFLSNPNDYALLTSAAWRQKVAQGLADAIAQYAQQYPASNTSQ